MILNRYETKSNPIIINTIARNNNPQFEELSTNTISIVPLAIAGNIVTFDRNPASFTPNDVIYSLKDNNNIYNINISNSAAQTLLNNNDSFYVHRSILPSSNGSFLFRLK